MIQENLQYAGFIIPPKVCTSIEFLFQYYDKNVLFQVFVYQSFTQPPHPDFDASREKLQVEFAKYERNINSIICSVWVRQSPVSWQKKNSIRWSRFVTLIDISRQAKNIKFKCLFYRNWRQSTWPLSKKLSPSMRFSNFSHSVIVIIHLRWSWMNNKTLFPGFPAETSKSPKP